jgi:hypothetical protein
VNKTATSGGLFVAHGAGNGAENLELHSRSTAMNQTFRATTLYHII